jgi:hypothetical protein
MKYYKTIFQILATLIFISCGGRTHCMEAAPKLIKSKEIGGTAQSIVTPPALNVKVAAYLVYKDGSISSFDVLNDKTVALWNTIIGGGDALKPSTKVKLVLVGEGDDLIVRIKNGKSKLIERPIGHFKGEIQTFIENTGCEEVLIEVSRQGKKLYKGSIPFHCGE